MCSPSLPFPVFSILDSFYCLITAPCQTNVLLLFNSLTSTHLECELSTQDLEIYFDISSVHVGTRNNLLTGKVIGVSSPSDARLNCVFLSGFTGTAHCRVQYGTDPTYLNLPYSAESTENGTAEDTVSVVLRERLNSSTVYFYTVSVVSGDITVSVQGNFITPQYSKYLPVMQMTHKRSFFNYAWNILSD